MLYLTLKWIHIIAIISWMAGLLYLFRLFVYHKEKGEHNQEFHELFHLMEKRLYRYITLPAMMAAWTAGLWIISIQPALMQGKWLHAKLLFVFSLSGFTGYAGKLVRTYALRTNLKQSSKTLRILNEVPTLLMLIIVGLVVFRPF